VPRRKDARCAACRQAHRSEEQCAEGECTARSERCEACRTGRRSAAECAVRHPQVFEAAQGSRGRDAADVARSGGQAMPTQLIQTVPDSAQREEGYVGKHEKETAQKARTRLSIGRKICNVLGDGCGLAPDTVMLSKIAMWAQGSGETRQIRRVSAAASVGRPRRNPVPRNGHQARGHGEGSTERGCREIEDQISCKPTSQGARGWGIACTCKETTGPLCCFHSGSVPFEKNSSSKERGQEQASERIVVGWMCSCSWS
jgi:hypothetical protein